MTKSELIEIAKNDVSIDKHDLVKASIETPMLLHKYLDLKLKNEKSLIIQQKEYNQLKYDKLTFYRTEHKIIPETANEMKMLLEGDSELSQKMSEIQQKESIIRFIDEIIKTLRERVWTIKNINEFLKLQSGA